MQVWAVYVDRVVLSVADYVLVFVSDDVNKVREVRYMDYGVVGGWNNSTVQHGIQLYHVRIGPSRIT